MDPTETMSQLAQFSTLQQTNILAENQSLATASNLIGTTVMIPGTNGNAAAFQQGGFSAPETYKTWSEGPVSTLVVPGFGAQPTGDLWLEIKGNGFIAKPHLVSRPLIVTVNGRELANFDIDELTHVHVFVDRDILASADDLVIKFRHPICASPCAMGESEDTRPLSFMFEFVALRRVKGGRE